MFRSLHSAIVLMLPRLNRVVVIVSIGILSGCTSFSFFAANTPASFGHYSRQQNVSYGEKSRNKLDVYRPEGIDHSVPIVIFIHGGGWDSGDKAQYKFVGAALAEQGYVAVLPNYSLYPQVKFPAFLDDAARAIVWVHSHAAELNGDVNQIYLVGHSAGAHIAVMLALNEAYLQHAGGDAHWLKGVVGLAGPYDFLPFTYPYMNDLFGPPDRFAESQPINYVRPDAPPLLLMHGLRDHTVAPTNTRQLHDAMARLGVNVPVEYFPDATHADLLAAFSFVRSRKPPVMASIKQFIDHDSKSPTLSSHAGAH
ncbi:MAG TPA: alpha/beta hydrolase [Steroidobacteraceae bacterium]|nr:alpha/beta hydrolase [Steroidobacteraceae bacterium]